MADQQIAAMASSEQSIIPAAPSSSALVTASSDHAQQTPQTASKPLDASLREGAEDQAWSIVARSLMLAVMTTQPHSAAASTLLGVFRPIVDGWAAARHESQRWKKRAELYMAEHHKHRVELGHKHDTLQAHADSLQQSLADSQARVRELESQQSTFADKVSSLEKALAAAETQVQEMKEAHAQEKLQSRKKVEGIAKTTEEIKMMYDKLRQETHNMTKSHNTEATKFKEKIKEMEGIKGKLEERLGSAIAKSTSLEGELAQKRQDITNLQARVTELTARVDTLQRQIPSYQRAPTRRWY